MLYVLIGIVFILGVPSVDGAGLAPSQEAFTNATQQAIQLQNETNKLIQKTFMGGSKKGCISQLTEGEQEQAKGSSKEGSFKGCMRSQTHSISPSDQQNHVLPHILVFVSFSLPEASLKSLAQGAKKHHATLVLRGLYQDSFVKTASKLQHLGITVDIHPELFETHRVTSVPTFVVLKEGKPVYSLKGNVTLKFVAEKFEEQHGKEAS